MQKQAFFTHLTAHKIIKVTVNSKWLINAKSYKYFYYQKYTIMVLILLYIKNLRKGSMYNIKS